MIARVWHGWTNHENAKAYETLLLNTILPAIARREIAGYLGTHLYRRVDRERVEFVTTMYFDSIESVRAFAGEDYETAVVPPDAQKLLARFDPRSRHYEVLQLADPV
jgi:hypothetical protein